MPSGLHHVEVDVPINEVWEFVKDVDNWAPLIPGYIRHQKFTNRQSTWEFNSTIGFIKKKISLMVTIKDWVKPTKVSFNLKGVNENFTGNGYFLSEAIDQNKTRITGYLEMNAGGAMGPIANTFLKSYLPKITEEMAVAISTKITELHRI